MTSNCFFRLDFLWDFQHGVEFQYSLMARRCLGLFHGSVELYSFRKMSVKSSKCSQNKFGWWYQLTRQIGVIKLFRGCFPNPLKVSHVAGLRTKTLLLFSFSFLAPGQFCKLEISRMVYKAIKHFCFRL